MYLKLDLPDWQSKVEKDLKSQINETVLYSNRFHACFSYSTILFRLFFGLKMG